MSGSTKFIQISVQAEFEGESLLFSLRGIDFSERSFLKLAKAHVGRRVLKVGRFVEKHTTQIGAMVEGAGGGSKNSSVCSGRSFIMAAS